AQDQHRHRLVHCLQAARATRHVWATLQPPADHWPGDGGGLLQYMITVESVCISSWQHLVLSPSPCPPRYDVSAPRIKHPPAFPVRHFPEPLSRWPSWLPLVLSALAAANATAASPSSKPNLTSSVNNSCKTSVPRTGRLIRFA